MATLKEVARLANVSLGTVSNVLNGKTHNEELIDRVEKAMKQLSYRPDATARSLKSTRTNMVGVILPDMTQKFNGDFLMELERLLRERGYGLSVKFSRNNRLIERKSIESFLDMRVDGMILYSVLRQKPWREEWKQVGKPLLLVSRHDAVDFSGDNIVLDYGAAFRELMETLYSRGVIQVGLVMDRDLLFDARMSSIFQEYYPETGRLKIVDGSQERGFQAMFELCASCTRMDAVIAGSQEIGAGIKKALEMLKMDRVPVYVIKESSWIVDTGTYAGEISLSPKQTAREAVCRLMEAIDRPRLHESLTRYIPAVFKQTPAVQMGIRPGETDLRFAVYDCSSARSMEMLTMIYERESGKKIHFDMYAYDELEKTLYERSGAKDGYYDGFMIDITWLEGLVESGCVKNLDHLLDRRDCLAGFIDGAVKDYGMYVESLYAIPFMSGAQILFYQEDLFENRQLQMRFKRKYGEELAPPKTWSQFNVVAEFFTQEYTPESPVKYGVSIPQGDNVYTAIEFLSRLWSCGGQVFNAMGEVCINSTNALQALKNLLQSYRYSSGKTMISWNETADEFARGNSAMVILYSSDAGDINNYTLSRIAGNIGFALPPGGTPVLGGWSLGLNRYGRHQEEAERFLLWLGDRHNGIPLSLLGGSTMNREYYERPDLENLEPWKSLVLESSRISRKRTMPEILDESRFKNTIYTTIIPGEIMGVVRGEQDGEKALMHMEQKIRALLG